MAKSKDASSDRWIQRAIRNPGALRRTAKRMGLIKGDEKLSETDLNKMASRARKTGDTTLMRRVNLARTLRKLKG
jgi:hypothetical protein